MKPICYRKLLIIGLLIHIFYIPLSLQAQTINIGGTIKGDVMWIADTVKITRNLTIEPEATLTIVPNTQIVFYGYYGIDIYGTLKIYGTNNSPVVITYADTTGFRDTTSLNGGWRGLYFKANKEQQTVSEIQNCRISFAKAVGVSPNQRNGGAIYAEDYTNITIENTQFSNCYAMENGGAIYTKGKNTTVALTNCSLTNNIAYGKGGALSSELHAQLSITSCKLQYNEAKNHGGAVFNNNGDIMITNTIIAYNSAEIIGGGICSQGVDFEPKIQLSQICNNKAYNGGGIFDGNHSLRINNCIIANNQAVIGGGIYKGITNADSYYINNNIVKNYATKDGGGVYTISDSTRLINCIIWGNRADNEDAEIAKDSDTLIIEYCLLESEKYASDNDVYGNPYFVYPTGFAGLQDDGVNAVWHITSNSPCWNAGTPDTTGLYLPVVDLKDEPRIQHENIDIGAYEVSEEPISTRETISSKKNQPNINVYPVPASTIIYIESDINEMQTAQLIDGRGKLLLKQQFRKNISFKTERYAKGIYFLRIQTKNYVSTKKIVIK